MHMFRFIVLGFVKEMCWGQHRLWTVLLALLTWTTALTADANPDPITTLRILLIAPFPDPVLQPGYDAGHSPGTDWRLLSGTAGATLTRKPCHTSWKTSSTDVPVIGSLE